MPDGYGLAPLLLSAPGRALTPPAGGLAASQARRCGHDPRRVVGPADRRKDTRRLRMAGRGDRGERWDRDALAGPEPAAGPGFYRGSEVSRGGRGAVRRH